MPPTPQNPVDTQEVTKLLDAMNKMGPALRDLGNLLSGISRTMTGVQDTATKWRKSTDAINLDFKTTAALTEDAIERTKQLLDIRKKMAAAGAGAESYEEVAEVLKTLITQTKTLAKEGIGSPAYRQAVERQLRDLESGLVRTNKEMKSGAKFSIEFSHDMFITLQKSQKLSERLVKGLGEARAPHLKKDVEAAYNTMRLLVGQQDKLDKYKKLAQQAGSLKKEHVERIKARNDAYQESHASTFQSVAGKVSNSTRYTHGHLTPEERVKHNTVEAAGKVAKEMGGSRLEQYVARRVAQHGVEGSTPSMGLRLAGRAMEAGEGSILRGLPALGADSFSMGGASLIEKAAPAVGIALEIGKVIKDQFNANQIRNQKTEKALGGAGLFGGTDSISAMQNARMNFNPGMFSRYGLTGDRNMQIAGMMGQSGFSIKDYADKQIDTEGGFMKGSMGTFQRSAAVYGRVAGMDDAQSVQTTMKLVTAYRQTLKSSENFFADTNKQARAAGITTIKYMDILDSANERYDTMNKSLSTTADILKLLGKTGRATVEDLKTGMDVIMNPNANRGIPVNSAVFSSMFADPKQREEYKARAQREVESQASIVAGVTGQKAEDISKQMLGSNSEKYTAELRKMIDNQDTDSVTKQTSQAAITKMESVSRRARRSVSNADRGVAGAVDESVNMESNGATPYQNAALNAQSIRNTLKWSRTTADELIAGKANTNYNMIASQVTKAPPSEQTAQQLINTRQSEQKIVEEGLSAQDAVKPDNAGKKRLLDSMYQTGLDQKLFGKSDDPYKALQDYVRKNGNIEKLRTGDQLIGDMGDGSIAGAAGGPSDKEAEMEKYRQRQLASDAQFGTLTTDSTIGQATEALGNLLIKPLNEIARGIDVVARHFGNENFATSDQYAAFHKSEADGTYGKTYAEIGSQQSALKTAMGKAKNPQEREGIMGQFEKLTALEKDFNDVKSQADSGYNVDQGTMNRVQGAIANFTAAPTVAPGGGGKTTVNTTTNNLNVDAGQRPNLFATPSMSTSAEKAMAHLAH